MQITINVLPLAVQSLDHNVVSVEALLLGLVEIPVGKGNNLVASRLISEAEDDIQACAKNKRLVKLLLHAPSSNTFFH